MGRVLWIVTAWHGLLQSDGSSRCFCLLYFGQGGADRASHIAAKVAMPAGASTAFASVG